MKLTPKQKEFADLLLNHYGKSLQNENHKSKIQAQKTLNPLENNQQNNEKNGQNEKEIDINNLNYEKNNQTKYSLNYNKFEEKKQTPENLSEEQKKQQELEEMYKNNPYLNAFGCNHDRRKERELFEKPTKEKIENAEEFKNQGNQHMKEKEFDKASYFYQKALIQFDYSFPEDPEQEKKQEKLSEICHQNMSMCKFNQKKYDDALLHARQTLKINENNIKAHYKMAQILLIKDDFETCQKHLNTIIQLDAKNTAALELQKQLIQKKQEYQQTNKQVYNKMFQKK
ncbi:hypothetical protein PPERSA_08142 [Pseudocohnilembus persalinus]|uniref:Tetratricopeptide repeat protein n=1 Tax=Pseudocohnilembus persalinus TaxID=266149 RepID=A0A0V0QMW5_PSEPJ|nr:hypothetical protein PPERSA_08142 [Pseudocohnilembus persalinus]|eukprot:KRX03400.1 hypothetical protein PPERSA_08142 [Pseudocohnilembus persalinus]